MGSLVSFFKILIFQYIQKQFFFSGVKGYLKFPMEEIEMVFSGTFLQGCMVDISKSWKLELRFKNLTPCDIEVGSPICAIGQIVQGSNQRLYLLLEGAHCISKTDEECISSMDMLDAYITPFRDVTPQVRFCVSKKK